MPSVRFILLAHANRFPIPVANKLICVDLCSLFVLFVNTDLLDFRGRWLGYHDRKSIKTMFEANTMAKTELEMLLADVRVEKAGGSSSRQV